MNVKSTLVFLVLASATTLPAQKILTGGPNEFGPIGITTAVAGPMPTVPGAPYTAEAVTEHTQTLADGNRIHQTMTSQVARDSQGRVRREESLPGPANAPHLILIDDPVAGVHWTLDPAKKTASQLPVKKVMLDIAQASAQNRAAQKMALSIDGPMTMVIGGGTPLKEATGAGEITKTDLGTQTVEGVQAQGVRITHTIPAGQMGNEQAIVITTETWKSPDLKVLVMSKTSDPRTGETIYRLTNIVRGEPDPALFQVPPDYTIQDKLKVVTDH
jgi:hypothetical protein